MRLKTYQASTMKEALDLVRKELGSEAIIVSNQQTSKGFSITAAVENKPTVLPSLSSISLDSKPTSQSRSKLKGQDHYSSLEIMELFCQCLEYHVVPEKITRALLERLKLLTQSSDLHQIDSIVAELLPHQPLNFKDQTILLNEGPSGAGKSMTTAKLASEYVLAGQIPLVITMDSGKAGAIEQLQVYTKALKIPLYSFQTYNELISFVRMQTEQKVIIIDTPGINPLNHGDFEMRQDLALTLNTIPLLIYPAGTDPYELLDYLDRYVENGVHQLILTKCDTTNRFGALITALIYKSVKLSHISKGAELGNRLRPVTTRVLLDLLTLFSQSSTYTKNLQKNLTRVS